MFREATRKLTNEIRDYFAESAIPSLRAYLGRVERGTTKDWRTPFFNKAPREEILDSWSTHLESIQDKYPTLWEFENDLREKVGPLSIMKPWNERLEDLDHYYELSNSPGATDIDNAAIVEVIKEFTGVRGLRIKEQPTTVTEMKKSTNSGSPYFTKRRTVVDKTIPCRVETVGNQVLQTLENGHALYDACAVIGWRGQEGGPTDDDVKQRVVWMFPFAVNIEELRLYQPLIQGCQKHNLVPAWVGMDAVDKRMTRLFDTKGKYDLVIATDFSKFDQHFGRPLQDAALVILRSLLVGKSEDIDYWFNEIFPIKYNIPIVTPQEIRTGRHGMGSGSGGTNADETLTHRALQYEAAILNGARLNPNSMCLGDDGVLSFPGISIEKVISAYTKHGLEMNSSKQYADTETTTYLRRWYNSKYRPDGLCRGVYSTYRAIGRLAGQERFYDPEIWTPEMVNLRYLSILENVKWHPLREEFVKWCMKGDKYKLGLSLPGFFSNLTKLAKEATDYMPDFLGYTRSLQKSNENPSGINDWWVVKYLKSLA